MSVSDFNIATFEAHAKESILINWNQDLCGAAADIASVTQSKNYDNFAIFVNNFHSSLKFNWPITDDQQPFLNLFLKPTLQGLVTIIHYKEIHIILHTIHLM